MIRPQADGWQRAHIASAEGRYGTLKKATDQARRIEFGGPYQSECAAGGRYGALKLVSRNGAIETKLGHDGQVDGGPEHPADGSGLRHPGDPGLDEGSSRPVRFQPHLGVVIATATHD